MEAKFLQDKTPAERLEILKANAMKAEEFTYSKRLDGKAMNALKNDLAKGSIALARLEEQKKEFMTELKAKLKPLKAEQAILVGKIRTEAEEVTEKVYLLDDQEEGLVGYYNSEGILVSQRALMNDERQFRIVDESSYKNGS